LKIFIPAKMAGICKHSPPYSSTLPLSDVFSVGAMHELSKGQARIIALLSVAAGIPLAAAIQFSSKELTSYPIVREDSHFSPRVLIFLKNKSTRYLTASFGQ